VTVYPTGEQYEISSGVHRAVITEVGATLRSYTVGGNDVVRGFAADQEPYKCRGQQLLPWPNRIRDGRYEFNGQEQQLALTEPERHNALHGLVRHVVWDRIEHTDDSLRQRVRVYPQPGWPGIVEATIDHTLSDAGLRVHVEVTNVGPSAVPFGYAAHPYLTVGETKVDEVAVRLPASRYLEVDPERLLPIEIRDVAGTGYDLRGGGPLGGTNLDSAFTGLATDEDGLWRVTLELGDRRAVMWSEPVFGWLQVFTGEDRRDLSLAVEPMTCGPDAFNRGPTEGDRIILEPGESFHGSWGLTGR